MAAQSYVAVHLGSMPTATMLTVTVVAVSAAIAQLNTVSPTNITGLMLPAVPQQGGILDQLSETGRTCIATPLVIVFISDWLRSRHCQCCQPYSRGVHGVLHSLSTQGPGWYSSYSTTRCYRHGTNITVILPAVPWSWHPSHYYVIAGLLTRCQRSYCVSMLTCLCRTWQQSSVHSWVQVVYWTVKSTPLYCHFSHQAWIQQTWLILVQFCTCPFCQKW